MRKVEQTKGRQASVSETEVKVGAARDFSIDEIAALFNHVDEQILELHRCSSDDFLGLNAKFKGFYKEAKGISTSAGALFLLFSEGANRKLIAELEDFYESLVRSQQQLSKLMDGSLAVMSKVRKTATALYLPFRNLSQNGSTLGLLLANISLGYKAKLVETGVDEAKMNALVGAVDEFVTLSLRSIKNLQHFSQRLDEVQAEVTHLRDSTVHGVESVIEDVHYGLILFAEKHEESQMRIPQITSKTDSCSKSIAGIITNLQYQDIIRQKMEHIQSAHQELMGELEAMKEKPDTDSEYWVKMLVQIRDISALQSAQLVATNREYQAAIETIAKHFRDIAADMEQISERCHDSLQASGESGSATAITDLLDRLKRSGKTLAELSGCVPTLRSDLEEMTTVMRRVLRHADERSARYRSLCVAAREFHATLLQSSDSSGNLSDMLGQMASVLEDLESFQASVDVEIETFSKCCAELESYQLQLEGEMPLWKGFSEGADRMHMIALSLAQTERESTELLGRIQTMSEKVSHDTHQALEGIRYYDFFERVIDDIIAGLNALSVRIKSEVADGMVSSDLERLRSLYTMESEHSIHTAFSESQGEGDVDLFGKGMIGNDELAANEDDDGLELF